jgi:hypothetical protein
MRHALTAASVTLTGMLAAGCGGSGGSSPAASTAPARSPASSAAAEAGPTGNVAALAAALGISRAELVTLDGRYLGIASPANRRLEVDNDGYAAAEKDNRVKAERFLRSEVTAEQLFDSELLQIKFPPLVEGQVQALVRANNERIALTQLQARATTLGALRDFDARHKAADAAVEAPVRRIRAELGLPPPETSLPTVAA